ncbi:MAG: hypothetical protein L7U87_05425 [Chlamydiales bacterium]|nr:hypothetical protein [Chlamydiales bacterium]
MEKDQIELLSDTILDPTAREDEKDDAAFCLSQLNDERALAPLIYASQHPTENDMEVLSDYGEAIGALWVKRGGFDLKIYLSFPGVVRGGIYYVLEADKPEWVEKYELIKYGFEN